MNKIEFRNLVLPHLLAIAVFYLLVLMFYAPIILENKSIRQNDIMQGAGASKEINDFRNSTGQEALWTNSMFSGMPAYLISTGWGNGILSTLQNIVSFHLPSSARETFLAFVCFYVLLISFGVRPWIAIAGAIFYGFNTYLLVSVEAGHIWKVRAMAYMPLVLAGVHLVFHRKFLAGLILTALGTSLEIMSNHLQITYYLLFIIAIYGVSEIFYSYKRKEVKPLIKVIGILLIGATIGVFTNLGNIWSAIEYGNFSTRGKSELTSTSSGRQGLDRGYVFNWSGGITESFTLLIPNFMGGASTQDVGLDSELAKVLRSNNVPRQQIKQYTETARTYWGDQPFTSGPIYGGVIAIFLAILGIFTLDKKTQTWLLVAISLSLILSWGKNFSAFNYLMYDYFPAYNKFRSVTMAITIALLCIPLMGIIGLEQFFQNDKKKNIKILLKATGITAGLCLLLIIGSGIFSFRAPGDTNLPAWYMNAIQQDRADLMKGDGFRSLFIILSFAGILYLNIKNKISLSLSYVIMFLIITLDLWNINRRYVNDENFIRTPHAQLFAPSEADNLILRDKDLSYRVLNLSNPFNEAMTSYHHSSIGGYHGAKLKRYQELIDFHLSNEIQNVIIQIQDGKRQFRDINMLNMLNTKYFLAGDNASGVVRNTGTLGNAWLVKEVIAVATADEEIARLREINPSSQAILNASKFNISTNIFSRNGSITLVDYKPNYLKYRALTSEKSFAVFSEIYYPKGWNAYVNGEKQKYFQVNYVLRGIEISGGENIIEFKFEPNVYVIGNKIVSITSIGLVLSLLGLILYSGYRTFKG